MPTWRSVIVYLFASLLVSAIFHSNLLARLAVDNQQEVGVPLASSRTDASDNYVYFGLIKQGTGACNPAAYPEAARIEGNSLACTYIGGILVGNVLWRLSHAVTTSERAAISLLLILCTALLAISLILAFGAVLDRQFGFASATAIAGLSLLLLDNFGLSFYLRSLYLNFRAVLDLEPGFARLLNPTIFWSFGLLTLAGVLLAMRQRSRTMAVCAGVAAVVCATAGLAVTAALIGGLGLFLCLGLSIRRRIDWLVFSVAAVLAAGAAYTLIGFSVFYKTRFGTSLHHGEMVGLRTNFYFLWLLVPVAIGRIGTAGREQNMLMKCLLLSSAVIGMFCDSVELGARLWLRGSCVFAFLACAAWLWNWAEYVGAALVSARPPSGIARWRAIGSSRLWPPLSAVAAACILFGIMQIVRPFDLERPRGFVDHDKYQALMWIERHTPANSVIASSSLEDSFLIDFYTRGKPYVPLYGLTILPQAELVKRYFRSIDEIAEGNARFDDLSTITPDALSAYNGTLKDGLKRPVDETAYQAFAFYLMLLYYPFTAESRDIFSAGAPTAVFLDWLRRMHDESHQECARYDYLIVRAPEHLIDGSRYDVSYRNASYVVLHPKHLDDGNAAAGCR